MPFEPVFETFNVRESKGETVNEIKIECRTDIPSDAVKKVISVDMRCGAYCGEIKSGRAEFFGRANFFIVYETAEGEIKKCECGAEFRDATENPEITDNCKIVFSCTGERAETSLSGVNLAAEALIKVRGRIFADVTVTALSGGEGIIADVKEKPFVRTYDAVSVSYPVEEEFEVNYNVKEVIEHRAVAAVTAVQCGVGAVICDGEIYLTEIFLQSGEKQDIIREDRTIPFRVEMECEEAMPSLSAAASVFVKSVKTDAVVDEENGVSTVSAAVVLDVSGRAESLESVKIAEDVFSTDCFLTIKKETTSSFIFGEIKSVPFTVKTRCSVGELPSATRLCAVMGERAEIVSVETADGGVSVTGTVTATALFLTDGESPLSVKTEFPFEKFIETDGVDTEISVVAKKAYGKPYTLSEIDMETELVFTVCAKKRYGIIYVSAVEEGEEKTPETAAVSVYIPIAGEGLWELSKRLNVSPEKLIAVNSDLQFPLSGAERIVVYRQI